MDDFVYILLTKQTTVAGNGMFIPYHPRYYVVNGITVYIVAQTMSFASERNGGSSVASLFTASKHSLITIFSNAFKCCEAYPYWPRNTYPTLHKKTNCHRNIHDFDAQISQYPCSCHSVHIRSAVNNGAITISRSNLNLNSLSGVRIIGYLIYGTVPNTQIMQGLPLLIIQLLVSLLLEFDLL